MSSKKENELEEDSKCKASRKMKWSLKKSGNEIFFFWKKNRKLPIEIFL